MFSQMKQNSTKMCYKVSWGFFHGFFFFYFNLHFTWGSCWKDYGWKAKSLSALYRYWTLNNEIINNEGRICLDQYKTCWVTIEEMTWKYFWWLSHQWPGAKELTSFWLFNFHQLFQAAFKPKQTDHRGGWNAPGLCSAVQTGLVKMWL